LRDVEFGKSFYDVQRFHAHPDEARDEIDDVSRLVLFLEPLVQVVHDAALLVYCVLESFHHPEEDRRARSSQLKTFAFFTWRSVRGVFYRLAAGSLGRLSFI